MKRKLKQAGFTLIELIAVMVISSIVAIIVSKLISAQLNSIYNSTTGLNADAQLRVALGRMSRDIRNVGSANSLSSSSTASQIVFVDSDYNSITFSRSGTSLMRNSDILIDGVQSLTFTYYDKLGGVIAPPPTTATVYVKITVVVALQNATINATTTVFLRNS